MLNATSPIEAALNRLTMRMPTQILELVFFPNQEHRTTDATNLNARIRELVIDPLVMTDINNKGGMAVEIDISQRWIKQVSPVMCLVNVPMQATQNRRITSTLNSSFGINMINNAAVGVANQSNQVLMGANRVFNSAKPPPYVGTPDIRVMGNNQLEIRNFVAVPIRIRGLVRVEYSRDFTELRPNYWEEFSLLVEQAIKAYCYNQMLAPMDRAFLQGGVEMGRISSKIEEWSDAQETYDDYLRDRWSRILILNDPILSKRHVKMISKS